MRVGSLFSGIGGLDLGLERAGMRVVWQCESDPYCRAVLRKHWPDVPCYEDVRTLGADTPGVDVLCGGFPCQPVSKAGKRRAQADDRWLWPYFARLIRDLRPRYALMENVPGLLTAVRGDAMGEVLGDLATIGYDAEWESIPATATGAPHLRDRVFILAYPDTNGIGLEQERRSGTVLHPREPESRGFTGELHREMADPGCQPARASRRPNGKEATIGHPTTVLASRRSQDVAYAEGEGREVGARADLYKAEPGPERRRREQRAESGRNDQWATEPDVGRVAHGVPSRVDRLRCLGNAVVPQVAEWIGRRIMTYESQETPVSDQESDA